MHKQQVSLIANDVISPSVEVSSPDSAVSPTVDESSSTTTPIRETKFIKLERDQSMRYLTQMMKLHIVGT